MIKIQIEDRGWNEAIAALEAYPVVAAQENKQAMNRSVLLVERVGKQNAPVGATGHLRSTLTHRVDAGGFGQVVGRVGSNLPYAPPVEMGSTAHSPNTRSLRYWVERKLGYKGSEAAQVTFLIARKIRQAGTKAHAFLGPAFDENVDRIQQYFETALDNIIKTLASR